MCWAHVYRALDKNIKNYCVDITSWNEIMDDVMFFQLCQSQAVFQKASKLFLTKWQDEKHFCDYFTKEWLHKHPGWYEGYMYKYPLLNLVIMKSKEVKLFVNDIHYQDLGLLHKILQKIGQKRYNENKLKKIFNNSNDYY